MSLWSINWYNINIYLSHSNNIKYMDNVIGFLISIHNKEIRRLIASETACINFRITYKFVSNIWFRFDWLHVA